MAWPGRPPPFPAAQPLAVACGTQQARQAAKVGRLFAFAGEIPAILAPGVPLPLPIAAPGCPGQTLWLGWRGDHALAGCLVPPMPAIGLVPTLSVSGYDPVYDVDWRTGRFTILRAAVAGVVWGVWSSHSGRRLLWLVAEQGDAPPERARAAYYVTAPDGSAPMLLEGGLSAAGAQAAAWETLWARPGAQNLGGFGTPQWAPDDSAVALVAAPLRSGGGCGDADCASLAAAVVTVVDATTGATRWTAPGRHPMWSADGRWLQTVGRPTVADSAVDGDAAPVVVDAATGVPVAAPPAGTGANALAPSAGEFAATAGSKPLAATPSAGEFAATAGSMPLAPTTSAGESAATGSDSASVLPGSISPDDRWGVAPLAAGGAAFTLRERDTGAAWSLPAPVLALGMGARLGGRPGARRRRRAGRCGLCPNARRSGRLARCFPPPG